MRPGDEAQAELLAACTPIAATEFAHSLATLEAAAATASSTTMAVDTPTATTNPAAPLREEKPLQLAGTYTDPKDFLLALMNDGSARPEIRLEAAKALLPYFHRPKTSPGDTP